MSRKGQGVYLCYGTSDSPPNLQKFQSKVAEGKVVPKMYMRSRDKPRDLGPSLYALHCIAMTKLLAIALRTIAIAIAIVAKKAIEYCNMQ